MYNVKKENSSNGRNKDPPPPKHRHIHTHTQRKTKKQTNEKHYFKFRKKMVVQKDFFFKVLSNTIKYICIINVNKHAGNALL